MPPIQPAFSTRLSPGDVQAREALCRLIPLWPDDVLDVSLEGRRRLIAKLARALRSERRLAMRRSHAYNLARHIQLARAYRAECEALARLEASRPRGHAAPPL